MILKILILIALSHFSLSLAFASCPERVLVAAVGDIMVHHEPQKEAHRSPDKFFTLWKPVAPYVAAADLAYGNLESPVAMGINAAGKDLGDIGFRYDLNVYSGTNMRFNYHPQVLTDLRKVGFDVLSTANNHAMDRRSIGVDRTLDELIRGNWKFTGTRYSSGHGEWGTSTHVKGKTLYWLSCAEHLNGYPDPYNQVLNCYKDQKEIERLVTEARKNHDAVFLLPHWGDEYSQTPNLRQRQWASRMAALQVTAIIGNHPHVLQPLEKINDTWVAFSLGNFSAWQKGVERKTSVILYFDLREDSYKDLKVRKVKALPIYRDGQIMYPYYNTLAADALRYVSRHMGADKIVRGVDFQSSVLACD